MASISFLVSFIPRLLPFHLYKPVLISKSQSNKAILHYSLGCILPSCHTYPSYPLLHLFLSPSFSAFASSSSPLPEGIQGHYLTSKSCTVPKNFLKVFLARLMITVLNTLCICWFPHVSFPGYMSIRDDPTKTCCPKRELKNPKDIHGP